VKTGLIQSLHNRASNTYQEGQDLFNEIRNMRRDLQLSGYPKGFIDSVISSKGSRLLNEEEKSLAFVYVPHVKGVSQKLKRIGNRYNIRKIFESNLILKSSLMKIRPEKDPQQTTLCVYKFPCEYCRSYIGETGIPPAVWFRDRQSLKEGLLQKSKLAQHADEEGHRVD
jgi:hypothetical protein